MNSKNTVSMTLIRGLIFAFFLGLALQQAGADVIVGGTSVGAAPPDTCNPEEEGEKIHGAMGNMVDATCDTAAIVSADDSGFFIPSVKNSMNDRCERARGWMNADQRKNEFKRMGKKNDSDCFIEELPGLDSVGNNDGVCTKDEWYSKKEDAYGCVEDPDAMVPEEADGDGVCELILGPHPSKKRIWEPCKEVCDIPVGVEDVNDCSTMDVVALAFEDAAVELESANVLLTAQLAVLKAEQERGSMIAEMEPGSDSLCLTASSVVLEFGGSEYTYADGGRADSWEGLYWATEFALISEQAANACWAGADTTIWGFDAPAICIPVIAVTTGLKILADQMELLDDAISGTRIDNLSLCVAELKTGQDETNNKLDGVLERLELIMDYLNMPPGQRPEFPKKP